MPRLAAAALLALLGLGSGCSTIAVDADWNPNARFEGMKSWAWLPRHPEKPAPETVDATLLNQRIENAVEDELAARGFTLTEEVPDFYVAYHVAIENKLEARTLYSGWGPGVWVGPMWSETYIDEYQLGTLLIDFIDPARLEVIWRGRAQGRVEPLRSPEKREARVREAVTKVLAQFPPKPSASAKPATRVEGE
jgi:hypothetical protein